ncbi:MAG TPA: hypothetical protein VGJ56_25105 [Reyranella sp.]|jgi:hypothetical protein
MRPVGKVLSVAIGLMAVLATTGAALAHDHDGDGDGWRWRHHHGRHFVPPGHVYYVERPRVIYAPPPRVYYPEPQYYGPPPQPSLNINIPLR